MSKHVWCFLAVITLVTQCSARRATTDGNTSGISSISFGLPANKDTNGKVLFDSYSVEVTTTNPACKSFEIADAEKADNLKIDNLQLKNACDYLLILNLGFISDTVDRKGTDPSLPKGNKKVLSKPSYSNINNPTKGTIISSDSLIKAPNGNLPLQIKVYRMSGAGPDTLQTPDVTNLDIKVQIGDGNSASSQPVLNANAVMRIDNDAHLQSLIRTYTDRRLVVQFSQIKCIGCQKQLEAMQKVTATLPANNKTVFFIYEIVDVTAQPTCSGCDPKNWNLMYGSYPETLVFENGSMTSKEWMQDPTMDNNKQLNELAKRP